MSGVFYGPPDWIILGVGRGRTEDEVQVIASQRLYDTTIQYDGDAYSRRTVYTFIVRTKDIVVVTGKTYADAMQNLADYFNPDQQLALPEGADDGH